jgi:hypothetical protein
MTGANLIDAVASRMGMNIPTSTTLPSRVMILEWINTATIELIQKYGDFMPQLLKSASCVVPSPGTHPDLATAIKILAVKITTTSLNATFVPINEFFTNFANQKTDKPIWTFNEVGTGKSNIMVSPTGGYTVYYAAMETLWTDAAAPTLRPGIEWEPEIIKHAVAWGKMAEQDPESYALIMGKAGQ